MDPLNVLKQGVVAWNEWRKSNPDATDIGFGLGLTLLDKDWRGANLQGVIMPQANFMGANFEGADLRGAFLSGSDFSMANFTRADLSDADIDDCEFTEANFTEANLTGARLGYSRITGANVNLATLTGCYVYALSAWSLQGVPLDQSNLIITSVEEPQVTVDDIEVAQFIHMLIDSKKVRNAIDTITSKVVLILGRFTEERKAVLNSIREELRNKNYLPILFDFDGPTSRNVTETVSTLAHLARFVIADLTDPRSIPQELMRIVPHLTSVPVQPLLLNSQSEYSMFPDLQVYPWVLPIYQYEDIEEVIRSVSDKLIDPAERWLLER